MGEEDPGIARSRQLSDLRCEHARSFASARRPGDGASRRLGVRAATRGGRVPAAYAPSSSRSMAASTSSPSSSGPSRAGRRAIPLASTGGGAGDDGPAAAGGGQAAGRCACRGCDRPVADHLGAERLRVHAVGDHQRDERVPALVERDPLETRVESGGGGIRTLGSGVTATTVFETAPFNHSGTPPRARHGRSRRVAAPAAGLRSGADRVGVPADDRRPPALAVDVDGDGEDALGRRRELLGELADAAHGLPRVIASATPSPCARAASIAWRSGSRSSCVVATTTAMRRAWASESDASAPISSATTFVRRPPPAARCC
jgi:hypothetical protein